MGAVGSRAEPRADGPSNSERLHGSRAGAGGDVRPGGAAVRAGVPDPAAAHGGGHPHAVAAGSSAVVAAAKARGVHAQEHQPRSRRGRRARDHLRQQRRNHHGPPRPVAINTLYALHYIAWIHGWMDDPAGQILCRDSFLTNSLHKANE